LVPLIGEDIMHIDLKFMKSWGAYNAGEIARFAREQAKAIIERGVAIEQETVAAIEQVFETKPVDNKGVSDKPETPEDSTSKGAKAKSG
jgi:hypothetical protein